MASRLNLHNELIKMLGTNNVYYQPPESIKMKYPAIVYSKSNIRSTFANDSRYFAKNRYELIVISNKPDDPVVDKLLSLQYCSFDRHYTSDNLNHDAFTLYY